MSESTGDRASNSKLYAERDPYALSPHFERHMLALTGERLESKSAIAAELAHRDAEIERLTRERDEFKRMVGPAEDIERENERLKAALELRNTALRLIKAGPPLQMANDEVAAWAGFIADEALSGDHNSAHETSKKSADE